MAYTMRCLVIHTITQKKELIRLNVLQSFFKFSAFSNKSNIIVLNKHFLVTIFTYFKNKNPNKSARPQIFSSINSHKLLI